ncbi:P-loop containing nucleoside triphosphate hydrolase protein [Thamnocephalis sphaerospora]|uniref:P-loop containing nucleoside triphosphate hydrolase protein n=1 Tax=Thamnocephalis sphaerospora TaxID=78915 RepID=A0A4P9XXK6_9FUNG|nr:P-loop containing nucleoside triphosphate hydrolase protein [Thamnocephalis sphaerospora]|eukprot:RKP11116.1 P-loop containing nucleoside triphosphate hydrolase protein [Thamnocephalis sphaerospora]
MPSLPEGRAQRQRDLSDAGASGAGDDVDGEELRVLQLDLKLSMAPTSDRLQASLEPGTLAPMLEDRLAASLRHLDNLHQRVSDTSFKVIVAGDVNSGKSSLVNALLRRTVVPVDQQPLTSAFLEVLDADLNDGVEEAHACMDRRIYDRTDPSTFWRIPLRHLEATMDDWEGDEHSIIKVYAKQASDDSALVHNDGVANLSVIDSPGLNTDSMKTFFLLTRQEEIDVVVFVLDAGNTLTLSGREFLEQAGKEKALLFFVVNRFESIRAKERCSRRIMEQIREVSPATYDEAEDLVHWISPTRVRLDKDDGDDDWRRMERCLRGFTLGRRTRTKLEPAKLYLLNVLADVRLLARLNRRDADNRLKTASDALEASRPGYDRLVASQRSDCATADRETESTGDEVRQLTRRRLRAVCNAFEVYGGEPTWPGFSGIVGYVDTIRRSMLVAWERELVECESATLERVQRADAKIRALGADGVLEEKPRKADLGRLFSRNSAASEDRRLRVRIDPWDLVDVRERIGIATAGVGGIAMIVGNLLGYKTLLLNAAHVGTNLGMRGLKRWFLLTASIAGVGAVVFIAGDMQHAVHRKVARKIRRHIEEAGLVDYHADRVTKRAQAALRFSAQDLRERYQRAVERERADREQRAQDQVEAKERRRWFRDMARRAKELRDLVDAVDCEDRMVPL